MLTGSKCCEENKAGKGDVEQAQSWQRLKHSSQGRIPGMGFVCKDGKEIREEVI